jgi:hypothetical protein
VIKELDRITVNPQICLGQPTIRGMRITEVLNGEKSRTKFDIIDKKTK